MIAEGMFETKTETAFAPSAGISSADEVSNRLPTMEIAMQKSTNDPLAIPDFLKVANRGKKFKLPKIAVSPAKKTEPQQQLDIRPDVAEVIEQEIKAGRFRRHWMTDASTLRLFERQLDQQRANKEAREAERMVAREAARAEREAMKALKPKFGLGIKIVVLNRDPKRMPGAARIPRFASLLAYLDKHPNASVAEVFENTTYIKGDFDRDQRLKIIKTDLISNGKKGK